MRYWTIFMILAGIFIAVSFDITLAGTTAWPAAVMTALDSAGPNRAQIEKVLDHYAADGDTLKLQAALYLIANMPGHCYVTYQLKDTTGKVVDFSALDYPTYDSLTASFGKMEKLSGPLDFKKKDTQSDIQTITAELLMSNIDYAFRAWRENPWAKGLTFDQFCRFVLPYRGSNEPLENWRPYFWDRYAGIKSQMTDSTSPVDAARVINKDVMSWFGFDPRYYYHPTDQGLAEMRDKHKGRCEDMTNLAIYAMRAMGLAVTSDYTPAWANTGNNHAWNAILVPGGKVIPFMGAESNPGDYGLAHKLAKAYRKTYEDHLENLIFHKRKQEKVPGWMGGKSYIDVTKDYVGTCDPTVTLSVPVPDSVDVAYLCVFNSGEWQPMQWGWIKGGSVTFAAMGTGVAYLPAYYLNEKIVPAGTPFILNEDCSMTMLSPDTNVTTAMQLTATTQRTQESSTDGIGKAEFKAGQEYELFYWDGAWKSIGKMVAAEGPLNIAKVPSHGLYWLTATGSDREERIFTIGSGQQVWW
jgi:hypothetical protein